MIVSASLLGHINAMENDGKLKWADNTKDDLLFRAVLAKNLLAVKSALKQGADVDAYCTNSLDKGKTPLAMACYEGAHLIAQCLIDNGADHNKYDAHGYTIFHFALKRLHRPTCVLVVEVLTRNGFDVARANKCDGIKDPLHEGGTPLHLIAKLMTFGRYGERVSGSHDISTSPQVFERLKLILTLIVKQQIHRAHCQGNAGAWVADVKNLFSLKNAKGKAAWQLFDKYEEYEEFERLKESDRQEWKGREWKGYEKLKYKLNRLEHPEEYEGLSSEEFESSEEFVERSDWQEWKACEQLEYKLYRLLHPKLVKQYAADFHLPQKVSQERKILDKL